MTEGRRQFVSRRLFFFCLKVVRGYLVRAQRFSGSARAATTWAAAVLQRTGRAFAVRRVMGQYLTQAQARGTRCGDLFSVPGRGTVRMHIARGGGRGRGGLQKPCLCSCCCCTHPELARDKRRRWWNSNCFFPAEFQGQSGFGYPRWFLCTPLWVGLDWVGLGLDKYPTSDWPPNSYGQVFKM